MSIFRPTPHPTHEGHISIPDGVTVQGIDTIYGVDTVRGDEPAVGGELVSVEDYLADTRDAIKHYDDSGKPVVRVRIVRPDDAIYNTYSLSANTIAEIAGDDEKRDTCCITNTGNTALILGALDSINAGNLTPGYGTISLPVGASRTFYHKRAICAVGANGVPGSVDVVIERYGVAQ